MERRRGGKGHTDAISTTSAARCCSNEEVALDGCLVEGAVRVDIFVCRGGYVLCDLSTRDIFARIAITEVVREMELAKYAKPFYRITSHVKITTFEEEKLSTLGIRRTLLDIFRCPEHQDDIDALGGYFESQAKPRLAFVIETYRKATYTWITQYRGKAGPYFTLSRDYAKSCINIHLLAGIRSRIGNSNAFLSAFQNQSNDNTSPIL